MKRVSWQSITPIFADIVISPWNLLIGGLLIKFLSTVQALISILIGYFILTVIFYFYGGLGFKEKKQSAEIFTSIFYSKTIRYLIPLMLAFGQIGWASINIELGGNSLAHIFSLPLTFGILIYALILILIALLNLNKMGIVKLLISISSILLLGYVFFTKFLHTSLRDFIVYQPLEQRSLFWGISIIVASLISFSTVTPDFFMTVKSKKDILISSILGVFIPGIITAFLGCFLFFDKGNFNLIALISSLTFPVFPHILNAVTNTDGSTAIYTPGLKFKNVFNLNLKAGIIIAGLISSNLTSLQISTYLESWLKILSLFFSTLIGVALIKLIFKKQQELEYLNRIILNTYLISVIISFVVTKFFPSVIISLIIPCFLYKSNKYIKLVFKN